MDKNTAFAEIMRNTDRLPTLPGIALKIVEEVRREEPDLNQITQIISSDPSLSAEILKCINSPFYSLKVKVTSVSHAVSMLGLNTVKNLALSVSLVKNFQSKGRFSFDYKSFWKNSLIGAVAARSLTACVKPDLAEDAFFLGLLHNIGILTLVRCLPKQYSLVLKEMQISDCTYHEAEDYVLGFNHMRVGKCLIESWGLPELFYLPIGWHHQPEKLSTTSPDIEMLTKILYLSTLFVDFFNRTNAGFTLNLIELCAEKYGFKAKINVEDIWQKIHQHTHQIFPLFEINIQDESDYLELLESARKEIIKLSTDLMYQVVQQKQEIQELREQIIRDGMTPLINYQYFHELLDQEIYRAKRYKSPLTIIIADIDDLQTVNEKFSHAAGDHVIKTVAACLRKKLRQSDHIARYGGDEFGIILPETALEDGLLVAERLREAVVSAAAVFNKKNIEFTLTMGLASLLPDQELGKDKMIQMADDALSGAKADGKNRCCSGK